MSVVTDTVLVYCGADRAAFDTHLGRINTWFADQNKVGLVSIDDPKLPAEWYGRMLASCVAVAAINHLQVERFLAFLRNLPWTDEDLAVQVLLQQEDEDDFRLYPVYPIMREPTDVERESLLNEIEEIVGDPDTAWFFNYEQDEPSAKLDELCRRYLASRGVVVPTAGEPSEPKPPSSA